MGKLIPLYKGKPLDRLSPEAYRPVSILPSVSKLVERQVQKQVLKYMEESGQLNKNGHAYRKCLGTTTALLDINDDINTAADERRIGELMTIDQSAAFECVNYRILDRKLKLYNFSENSRKWFENYLNHRSQYVSISTKESDIKTMKQGVPQGSILGPLIFIIYMNELPQVVKEDDICKNLAHKEGLDELFGRDCTECGKIVCYSDDSTYVTSSKTREENQEKLNVNLKRITEFLTANKMSINQSKTKIGEFMVNQKKSKDKGKST